MPTLQVLARQSRLRIARVVAWSIIVFGGLAVLLTIVSQELVGMSVAVTAGTAALPVAVSVVIVRREPVGEWPLRLLIATAVGGVLAGGGLQPPGERVTFLWLGVALLLSSMVLRARDHAIVIVTAALGAAAIILARSPRAGADLRPLAAAVAIGVISWLAVRVHTRTLAELGRERDRARSSSDALRAVVDAARTATNAEAQDVLDAVVEATTHLGSDMCGLYLIEDGELRYGAARNIPPELVTARFPRTSGIAGDVIAQRRTIVVDDYDRYGNAMQAFRGARLRAAIGSPIHIDDEIVGVLVAGRFGDGQYDEVATSAFELLAGHAGRALALARAIGEDRATLASLQHLHALQEDFVSTVSHELRTPITVIDGMAQTMLRLGDTLDPEQHRQLLERLAAHTHTLSSVVMSILELARLDRGLAEVADAPVSLGALTREALRRLEPVLAGHAVAAEITEVTVAGDRDLLERVLDNLLTNVARHTPPGTAITVRVSAAGGRASVAIEDDGPGIPAHEVHRITERFRRGGDANTRETRGLGIGLALAEQVLRHHSSRLRVRSTLGEGTTFWFELPIRSPDTELVSP